MTTAESDALIKLINDEMAAEDGERRVDRVTRMLVMQMTLTNGVLQGHVTWCSKVQIATLVVLAVLFTWSVLTHPAILPYLGKFLAAFVG